MLKIFSYIIKKLAIFLLKISKSIYKENRIAFEKADKTVANITEETVQPSAQSIRVIPWFSDNGDKTHRLNYNLHKESVIFDLGGYEGQWASDIYGKYGCKIHIFEPHPKYATAIQNRFKPNEDITVHSFGLAGTTVNTVIYIDDDSTSIFKKSEHEGTEISLIEAGRFIEENNIDIIDLMKINIEGSEYELLEHLIASGLTSRINNIQVQFHDFVEDAEHRMRVIQQKLTLTHHLTYQYEFVWENWEKTTHIES